MTATLDTLRARLQTLLGFRTSGTAAQNQKPLLEDLLQTAQEYVYGEVTLRELNTEEDQPITGRGGDSGRQVSRLRASEGRRISRHGGAARRTGGGHRVCARHR